MASPSRTPATASAGGGSRRWSMADRPTDGPRRGPRRNDRDRAGRPSHGPGQGDRGRPTGSRPPGQRPNTPRPFGPGPGAPSGHRDPGPRPSDPAGPRPFRGRPDRSPGQGGQGFGGGGRPDDRRWGDGPPRDRPYPPRDRFEPRQDGPPRDRPYPPRDRFEPRLPRNDGRSFGPRQPSPGRPYGRAFPADDRSRQAYAPGLPSPVSIGEGEELVAGRRPVEEAFVARRPALRLLVVPQRRAALEKLVLHATNLRIPIVEVEGGSLTAIAGFDGHQGVALVVEPRRYAGIDDVLARAVERGEPPFVLVLDSLEDPHNVGSLLRSAEAAGVHGVVFPTHRQAPMSPSAVKASAGAIEHLLLCPVDDLAGALSDLHARGLRIAGADGGAAMTARHSDLRGPLAIVVGSEGQGLGSAVRRRCDLFMRIPMRGSIGSLNAAVAGSILLFEAVAQRDLSDNVAPAPPAPEATPGPPDGADVLSVEPDTTPEAAAADVPESPSTASAIDPAPEVAPMARRPSRRKVIVEPDHHDDAQTVAGEPTAPPNAEEDLLPVDGTTTPSVGRAIRKRAPRRAPGMPPDDPLA
ncbi:MAG: 23S rRNA (guanosine(2251)-2'-O)-methyltransferase RlmB [Candidatus Limnocylindrales bacterium]